MAKKSKKRLLAERRWWRRTPWPAIVLAIDPGREAGAAIFGPFDPVVFEVDIFTRDVEGIVELAAELALKHRLPLVLALEEWGKGGPLGIDQWIGLGESRGAWRRAFIIYCRENAEKEGRIGLFVKTRIILVPQTRWRSVVVEETGFIHPVMGWRPFATEEWKEAATRSIATRIPGIDVDGKPNAAEAACLGLYVVRSDELGKMLPATFLASHGLTYPPKIPTPRPRMRRRRA